VDLFNVIEELVDDRGLDRGLIEDIVCDGIKAAYLKKYPETDLIVSLNNKTENIEVFVKKKVVSSVEDENIQISLRKAKNIKQNIVVGDALKVPFEKDIGRIEIITAKQIIANKIVSLEQAVIYDEYKEKKGSITSGIVHKKERAGWVIKIRDVLALLPNGNAIPGETLRTGSQVKVLFWDVLKVAQGEYQIILDRGSNKFIEKLLELEVPEVFEGIVEIKKVARCAGYKTKVAVISSSKEIDPVGTCVGLGGTRIKPILKEVGKEKIDLIGWSENLEKLVAESLKPAEIDKVEISDGEKKAVVWLAQDQRSIAIGKMGRNIALASKLVGFEIKLQDISESNSDGLNGGREEFFADN
jgi:transcription termination/antitermination protein NusA